MFNIQYSIFNIHQTTSLQIISTMVKSSIFPEIDRLRSRCDYHPFSRVLQIGPGNFESVFPPKLSNPTTWTGWMCHIAAVASSSSSYYFSCLFSSLTDPQQSNPKLPLVCRDCVSSGLLPPTSCTI